MALVARGVAWVGLYLAVAAGPLVFAVVGPNSPGRGFWTEFSIALGFVGMPMLGMQFALVARFQAVAAPFGEDALIQFHRQISYVALVFILAVVDRSPFAITSHPSSFSSSAGYTDTVQMTIKALGDFTSRVGELRPGTRALLDGPHGVFSPDLNEGPGFVLIAGGVGITPMTSILRTMADRGDSRPVLLLYASNSLAGATLFDELEDLAHKLVLTVVHIPENADPDWTGEQGFIDAHALPPSVRAIPAPAVLHLRPGADGRRCRRRAGVGAHTGGANSHRALQLRLRGRHRAPHLHHTRCCRDQPDPARRLHLVRSSRRLASTTTDRTPLSHPEDAVVWVACAATRR
ncbi:hypothetical protein ACWDNI_22475 [Nocardia niigatensis]